MATPAEQRRRRMLEVVRERGSIRVAELAAELGVAPVTARRDVALLASRGLLQHGYGYASWPEHAVPVPVEHPRPAATLGMLIPSAGHDYAEVVRGAEAACEAAGARLVLGITGHQPSEDDVQVARLLDAGAHGLLLSPSRDPDPLDVPCVLVERRPSSPTAFAAGLDRVRTDHAYGAFLALRHLTSLGHRRIALAARVDPTGAELRAGYRAALDALDLGEIPVIDTYSLETDPAGFQTTVERLLAAVREGVSAVLVHSDVDAITLVQRLATAGVRVPRDVSVIAYDDEVAAFADTPLSAVRPPKREVGRTAAEVLLRRLAEGEWSPRHVDLLPRLTIRDSCRAFESDRSVDRS